LLDQHAVQKLLDQHDVQTSIVDANLQILSRGIPAPWDTRRRISNHAHDAAMADAAGRSCGVMGIWGHFGMYARVLRAARSWPAHAAPRSSPVFAGSLSSCMSGVHRPGTGSHTTDCGEVCRTRPIRQTPPSAARAALAGARCPAQLTSFCPAPSTHLGKGRGMFDGKALIFESLRGVFPWGVLVFNHF
jgi:hypothetical protein